MNAHQNNTGYLMDSIIKWFEKNEYVRALLLTGSRAGMGYSDNLSDYDIAVFGNNFEFIENNEWLDQIGNYWVCVSDRFEFSGYVIPTRLVIFNKLYKVDFSFHPVKLLERIFSSEQLPDS